MRIRATAFVLTTVALIASACITDQRPVIFISFDPLPPDTVQDPVLFVTGVVVRAPPDPNAVFVVTAIAVNSLRVDTVETFSGSAGVFTLRVPIAVDSAGVENTITVSAVDEDEDSISDEQTFTVIGLIENPVLRREDE
jgi:hypothetical protein